MRHKIPLITPERQNNCPLAFPRLLNLAIFPVKHLVGFTGNPSFPDLPLELPPGLWVVEPPLLSLEAGKMI